MVLIINLFIMILKEKAQLYFSHKILIIIINYNMLFFKYSIFEWKKKKKI